ncbi:MAG TPA: thioredoxin domain-containing protein [Gemmatimonadaceae bacterium]|jgi:protein-disulfide isomerase
MATKRVESGRGKKAGVVKSAKQPVNRAFYSIIGVIAVLGIVSLAYLSTRPKDNRSVAFDSTLPKVASQGYVMGSPTAPLEVTEFGDFECPQCGRFATLTEPDIRTRLVNTGQIRWRYIDFPLEMHKNTWNASIAAACADEQGRFWEMHDAIFAAQDQWNGEATGNPNKVLKQIGEPLVSDKSAFDKCIDDQKTKPKIQAHYQLATARKLPGTPSFIIGDQQISEFLTYDDFKKIVDQQIAKIKPGTATPGSPTSDSAKSAPLKKAGE